MLFEILYIECYVLYFTLFLLVFCFVYKKQKKVLTKKWAFDILVLLFKKEEQKKKKNDLWKLSKTSIQKLEENEHKFFLESLILAQDERWRHA